MVINKRKKNSRSRGDKTHGYGSMKKHRGAGNRGGRGMAGSGKRGDANKPKIWGNKKYFGKYGFKKKGLKIIYHTINVGQLEKIAKNNEVNLAEIKVNKLLGGGEIKIKLKVTVDYASKKAIEKVNAAGGEVVLNKGGSEEDSEEQE